jgi:hypothetical protein
MLGKILMFTINVCTLKRNKNDQRSRRTSTFCMLYFTLNSEGPGWLNELDSWITLTTHASEGLSSLPLCQNVFSSKKKSHKNRV